MKQRLAFSSVSSPVRQDDPDLTSSVSYLSPKLRLSKALKEPLSTRLQTRQIKTRSVKHSREPSLDLSTPTKLAANKNSRLSQDLRESLENISVDHDQKSHREPANQKLTDLLKIVREFIGTSEKVVERLGMPLLSKSEINMIQKKYKAYQRTLEDNITKMEKDLLEAPKYQKTLLDRLAAEDLNLKDEPSSHYGYLSSAFGSTEKLDYYNQPDQEEILDKLNEMRRSMKGLQDDSSTLMKKVMSPSKSNSVLEGLTPGHTKNSRSQHMSPSDENKRKENEFRKMASEIEVLKNEKALMLSECKKAHYLYENQKISLEETKRALIEAQNNAAATREAFNMKINTLQKLVQNSFKGIELFEPDTHKTRKNDNSVGNLYSKMKEVERNISEALKDQFLVQKTKNLDFKNQGLESIREEFESSSCNTESYPEERRYSSSQDIGRNLDMIMNKLEDRERDLYNKAKSYGEVQKTFEERERENERSLQEVDLALKRCLDITTQAKKQVTEITSSGPDVKSWLEKENEMLREGLTNVLEKVKHLNDESEALRETLENSLAKIGDVIQDLEEKIAEIENDGRMSEEEDLQRSKAMLKETFRNAIRWLKELLQLGSSWQTAATARQSTARSTQNKADNRDVEDVLQICEGYISKLKFEKESRERLSGSGNKRNTHNRSNGSIGDDRNDSKGDIKAKRRETFDNLRHNVTGETHEKRQEKTEKKFKEIWKGVSGTQKK